MHHDACEHSAPSWPMSYVQVDSVPVEYRHLNPSCPLPPWRVNPETGMSLLLSDPPEKRDDVYKWTANIPLGIARVNEKRTVALQYFTSQVSQFNEYNRLHPDAPVSPPADTTEGKCAFSYSPTGSQHSFLDAIWIKSYNGNSKPRGSTHHSVAYLSWDNSVTPPAWEIVNLNIESKNYAELLCNDIP